MRWTAKSETNRMGLPQSRTSILIIHPHEPLVERGGSIQLNCSMDCPGGKVQWEGLDTDLGNVITTDTFSILTVTNASVSMEGMKICTGQCQRKSFQKKVDLKVYSLPDTLQLDTQPKTLTVGQSARLFCSVDHVYPPGSLTLSWFQGDERLMASEEEEEEEVGESKEQLFVYHSELEVPMTAEHTSYKCEATLKVGRQTFRRNRVVTIDTQVTQGTPIAMETTSTLEPTGASLGTSPEPSTRIDWKSSVVAATGHLTPLYSTETLTVAASEATDTAAPMLESLAGTSSPTLLGEPSTRLSSPAQNLAGETSRMATTSVSSPTSTFPLVRETLTKVSVASPGPLLTTQPDSTNLLSTMDATGRRSPSVNPGGSCRPVITTIPQQGTMGESLRISCHAAECSNHVQVHWVETPIAQSQYHSEKAEGRSILTVESINLEHQGVYRCITQGSQSRMARVQIVVSPAAFSTSSIVAIGTAGSLLGLIVTSYVSHRLRRRSN
ncbi:hypothetical protein lerEdw1_005613 [Lerista edwardsae]|nr:hypothetical protein lerEdw1_005613 [Lerista edwardsae]